MLYAKHYTVVLLTSLFVMSLFTSYLPEKASGQISKAKNHLSVEGIFNYDVPGSLFFEEFVESSTKGIENGSLTLTLESTSTANFAVLLANTETKKPISIGTYKINVENIGGIPQSVGVFGYFNNPSSAELPFYTHHGAVTITEKTEQFMVGSVQLELINADQKRITLKGNFFATKKE